MKYISKETTDENILVITIDCPDTKVNKVSSGLLDEILAVLENDIEATAVKGLAVLSAKDDNFVVGADVDELQAMETEAEVKAYIKKAHDILNRIEALPIPVVCGIHGNCLGGGLELSLVADYRIASDSTSTVMGLPEVQLGLLPAAGGTQRLHRLVGLTTALPMMLTAKNVRVKKAKKMGLIDEIVSPFALRDAAIKSAVALSKNKKKKNKRKKSPVDMLLESNPIGRKIVFSQARKGVLSKTFGLYPAPMEIIASVESSYRKGIKKGLEMDVDRFANLVMSSESKSLMSLFFAMNELKKNPLEDKAKPVGKLGILGAGLMGAGIATVSTPHCETILLKDVSLSGAASGMKEVAKSLNIQSKSGGITAFERDARYGKLIPCDDYLQFKSSDLVIEAVFEDLTLKQKVLKDVEDATDQRTIFASNTSAIPIGDIAQGCQRPENVIGMHYFSPVHMMPLLEIITTEQTADHVTATALAFGIKQGKTCIVVKDGPGFYTTRILAPLLNEAVFLLEEGVTAPEIDKAMQLFGYPVGPVTLLDEVGIDVGAHVGEVLGPMFEARGMVSSSSLPKLFEKGFLGKKNKKGFYDYTSPKKNGMRQANMDVYKVIENSGRQAMNMDEIQQRIGLMMVNEAALCLEEGIISCPRDGDVGAILGLGFPPFTGGPFRYVDSVGVGIILEQMNKLFDTYGERFKPAGIIKDMAKKNSRFHS